MCVGMLYYTFSNCQNELTLKLIFNFNDIIIMKMS